MDRSADPLQLLLSAQRQLSLNNRELAERLGVAKRTLQRWLAAGTGPLPEHLQTLARELLPTEPELARQLAAAARLNAEALGLPPVPALEEPAPPPRPREASAEQAESVVYAAANAVDLAPRAVLPAVVAALRRALALGVDVESLLRQLEQKP